MSLADFQAEFVNHLRSPQLPDMAASTRAAFTIYRNTVTKSLIDALTANYPTVVKLVGEEWFSGAAAMYVSTHPSDNAALVQYGESFPSFLAQFPPASELPYLSDVARIDQLWMESYFAPDAALLPAMALKELDATQLMGTRLHLHPATRHGSVKHSALSIWLHNQKKGTEELAVDDSDEDLLITRTHAGVQVALLCAIEHRFLLEIENGATLGEAAMIALGINPEFPLAPTLAKLISSGAFTTGPDTR